MAVFGPFIRTNDQVGTYRRQFVYKWGISGKQKGRPPLPYYLQFFTARRNTWGRILADSLSNVASTGYRDRLYAKAYDRLHGQAIQNRAELGINLIESSKALQTISKRSLQLLKMANAARKLDVPGFIRAAGADSRHLVTPKRQKSLRASASKSAGDLWLEGNFFWKPFLQDIYTCSQVLQSEFPFKILRARAHIDDGPNLDYNDGGSALVGAARRSETMLSAVARIDNPNLFLANQLGLVNPAFIAWDAVPFSFVVDWFLPVSAFLKSFSNDVGYHLERNVRSERVNFWGRVWHVSDGWQNVFGLNLVRTLPSSFPLPGFASRIRVPELDPWKAATSVALLLQQLSKMK